MVQHFECISKEGYAEAIPRENDLLQTFQFLRNWKIYTLEQIHD